MSVYMIQAGDERGPVKIGFAANPKRRLAALQTGHPERLSILRLFDGGKVDEASLHAKFSTFRLSGEWFSFHESMLVDVGLVDITFQLEPDPVLGETLEVYPKFSYAKPSGRTCLHEELLADVDEFLRANDIASTSFGVCAVNDGKFVPRLRAGANMRLSTLSRVRDFIRTHGGVS